MEPLVSILIPAFNAEGTIAQTLRSAINQTWTRKEIIVVNDGSRDNTQSIAEGFSTQGVRVVSQQNQGAAAARNQAFASSRGEYIQWLDADDLLSSNKISAQMKRVQNESSGTLLSSGWGQFFHRASHAKFRPSGLWADVSPLEWLTRKMEQNVYMQTATWLVPREVTEKAGLWDTRLLGDDDGEYFCRVILNSKRIRFVPEGKVFYRMSGSGSLSYIGHSDQKKEAQLLSMRLHVKYIRSLDDSPRVRHACVTYLQNWLINFYPERMDLVQQASQLANELGGELKLPQFSWKYSAVAATCGPAAAKRAQILLPRAKWSLVARWDKMMANLQQESA